MQVRIAGQARHSPSRERGDKPSPGPGVLTVGNQPCHGLIVRLQSLWHGVGSLQPLARKVMGGVWSLHRLSAVQRSCTLSSGAA